MGGYIIYHYNILDHQRINDLGPLSLPIIEKYGGELAVASPAVCLEGTTYTHMVAYRFNSQDAAKAFYESSENQELSRLRREITEGVVVYVPEQKECC